MKAIEIKNLSFYYRSDAPLLKNINLELDSGKYYVILGHNGSGKSTLAKLMNGLLVAKSGEIRVFDTLLNEQNIYKIRKDIGMVFQNPDNQFLGSTVRDDIAFGLENREVPQNLMDGIILENAQKVHMEGFLDKEPTQLSGGQKQRVAIAGVLAMNPRIFIFDEATSMLDPNGRQEVVEAINNMRKENKELTIISITHDVNEAINADEVIIISKGEILEKGKPLEVFSKSDSLVKAKLDLPFFLKLNQLFINQNIQLEKCDNLESVVASICKLKSKI